MFDGWNNFAVSEIVEIEWRGSRGTLVVRKYKYVEFGSIQSRPNLGMTLDAIFLTLEEG